MLSFFTTIGTKLATPYFFGPLPPSEVLIEEVLIRAGKNKMVGRDGGDKIYGYSAGKQK